MMVDMADCCRISAAATVVGMCCTFILFVSLRSVLPCVDSLCSTLSQLTPPYATVSYFILFYFRPPPDVRGAVDRDEEI